MSNSDKPPRNPSVADEFQQALANGIVVAPANETYGLVKTGVYCDTCASDNLKLCVRFGMNDVCFDCFDLIREQVDGYRRTRADLSSAETDVFYTGKTYTLGELSDTAWRNDEEKNYRYLLVGTSTNNLVTGKSEQFTREEMKDARTIDVWPPEGIPKFEYPMIVRVG